MSGITKRTLLVGTASALAAPTIARAQTVVQLGCTVPITGNFAPAGIQYYNSLRMAQDEINAVPGGPRIRITFEDTQASNTTAVNAFVKLVRQVSPPFVFLSSLSTQNLATEPEVARAQIPCFYTGGAVAVHERRNPYMFRLRPPDTVNVNTIAYGVTDVLKRTKPGILYTQDDYGTGGATAIEALLTRAGAPPVAKEAFSPRDNDFSAQLLTLRSKGANVIVIFSYNRDGALLMKQRRSLGIDIPVVAGAAMIAPSTLELLEPEDLAGVHAAGDAVLGETVSPESAAFVSRFTARWGFAPDPFGSAYYDGAMIVARGLAEVGPDAAKLRDYVAKLDGYRGVTRTYRTDSLNNLGHNSVLVEFEPGTKTFRAVATVPPA